MAEADIYQRRVLIVDDQHANVHLLVRMLTYEGYVNLRGVTDSSSALAVYREFRPDLLLLDLHMPGMTGFEVMEQLQQVVGPDTFFPILILTADNTEASKQRALARGAKDFLTKPFDQTEVVLRIKNLLQTQSLHRQLLDQNQRLEERVRSRTRDLEEARLEVLERLSLAAEYRDDDTGQHTQRVGWLSALLARALGFPDDQVELIRRAAPLHDLGKIGVPDTILLKAGKLTTDELQIMKMHTVKGARILSGSKSPLLQMAEQIAMTHHECWNGTGYPLGLCEQDIPLCGRIVSVADVFDALTHERPYKEAWPVNEALAEITRLSGQKFDPRVVEALQQVLPQLNP